MKFDVIYSELGVDVQPHYCRGWDESGGCYGTNPDHGYTWEEARAEAAKWHEQQAAWWASAKPEDRGIYENTPDAARGRT